MAHKQQAKLLQGYLMGSMIHVQCTVLLETQEYVNPQYKTSQRTGEGKNIKGYADPHCSRGQKCGGASWTVLQIPINRNRG